MKSTFKKLLGIAGVSAAALVLAACSSSSSSSNGKTTVQFFSTKTENASTFKSLIKKFEKANPKIKVEFSSPTNAQTVLKTDLTKGKFPDVVAIGGDATFVAMDQANAFENLSGKSYVKNVSSEYKGMITSLSKGKKLTAIPYATNATGVIYNKDLFTKAGIKTVPTTWDEMIADAKTLKAKGITPFGLAYKDAWTTMPLWNQAAGSLIPQSFYNKRLANKTTFAKTHKTIIDKWLQVLPYGQKDYMGTTYNDINQQFADGKVAMIINGNYEIPEITKLNKNINLDMFMVPVSNNKSQNHVVSGVDVAFGIHKGTKVSSAADKLVAFMMKKSSAQQYNKEQFSFSAVKGVTQDSKLVAGIADQLTNLNVRNYPDHYYPSAYDQSKALSQAGLNASNGMSNSKNATETLKQMDTLYNTANVKSN